MRWLMGVAAGAFAGIAVLALAYSLNQLNDWHEHRAVALGQLAALEEDPGYPNREENIRSERAQLDAMDREVRNNGLASAFVLALAVGAFVPLWRRAVRSFGATKAALLAAITASLLVSALAFALVVLSAGAIRG